MVKQLCKDFNPKKDNFEDFIGGYFLALDMTERDQQSAAKKNGRPWTLAKGSDNFMPVSDFIPHLKTPHAVDLEIKVNGETKQKGNTKDFIFTIP